MIQQESELEVADNTGAKKVKCIKVLKGSKARTGDVGDVIICSVQESEPNSNVKKGDVVRAVIVRTASSVGRPDGWIKFDDNACVIIDEKGNPRGTRIFGSIPREIKEGGFLKISSLGPEVI